MIKSVESGTNRSDSKFPNVDWMEKFTANTPISVIHAAMKSLNNARKLPRDVASKEETNIVASLVVDKLKMTENRVANDNKPEVD